MPNGNDRTDLLKHELLTKLSFEFYRECLKNKRYENIKVVSFYDREKTAKDFKKFLPAFLYNKYESAQLDFGNGQPEQFTKMSTFKIDADKFLEELRVEAVLRGVKFVEKKFASLEEIIALSQNAIFNCTGLSSKYLFGDDKIVGSTTQYVIFKNPLQLDYSLNVQVREGLEVRVDCSEDRITLRAETSEASGEEFVRDMVSSTQAYFSEKALQAKL